MLPAIFLFLQSLGGFHGHVTRALRPPGDSSLCLTAFHPPLPSTHCPSDLQITPQNGGRQIHRPVTALNSEDKTISGFFCCCKMALIFFCSPSLSKKLNGNVTGPVHVHVHLASPSAPCLSVRPSGVEKSPQYS